MNHICQSINNLHEYRSQARFLDPYIHPLTFCRDHNIGTHYSNQTKLTNTCYGLCMRYDECEAETLVQCSNVLVMKVKRPILPYAINRVDHYPALRVTSTPLTHMLENVTSSHASPGWPVSICQPRRQESYSILWTSMGKEERFGRYLARASCQG
ncbi:hypothetical protein BO83DRAFT_28256 [Aspergillus eucalypticola CBS 122712]|uniref:Uncharacterized protein n=1 Tax=Aspergillus eucalypticola (strain CBS 122712 / IBT 29274) TaxID=1448314 RepID=A0A317VMS7_ASPEC|nr:uncharacterized protein BO83DRAFT_28256 [Aspergillus eucalypticola CBS 122712]PWY74238.1 hypothetical protein BO83DRAFT_28256 [Aspergillus eucalypticola CBS 122712]